MERLTDLQIRDAREDDIPAIVELINVVHPPEERTTVEEFRAGEALRSPKDAHRRLVAAAAERLVAVADAGSTRFWPAHKFRLYLAVHPEYRRQGIGTAIERRLRAFAHEHGGTELTAMIREGDEGSRAFLERLGYGEAYRRFEMELDVAAFDWSRWQGWRDRLGSLRLFTYAEAGPSDDGLRKLFAIEEAAGADIPHPEGAMVLPFEEFVKYAHSPMFRPDALFILADGDRWVGMTGMFLPEGRPAHTYFTGVLAEYRGRGLATLLKLASIEHAARQGVQAMRTTNDTLNVPILSVNERLGYRRLPARVAMKRTI